MDFNAQDSLFVRHMGLTTLTSTIKTTAAMIIAASDAFGMYEKYGVKNRSESTTRAPV